MTLEKRFMEKDAIVDKFVAPAAAYAMTIRDQVLRPAADGTSGAFAITLPPVDQAAGMIFSILCRNADAVNTITIQDKDDSECWAGDIVLNGRCDKAIMYSDGLSWHRLALSQAFTGTTVVATTAAP